MIGDIRNGVKQRGVVEISRDNKDKIREFGVKRIGLFGSFARGEATEDSDIDLIVEFEKGEATLNNFMRLVEYLETLFGRKVDILTPGGVRTIRVPQVKKSILESVVYVA